MDARGCEGVEALPHGCGARSTAFPMKAPGATVDMVPQKARGMPGAVSWRAACGTSPRPSRLARAWAVGGGVYVTTWATGRAHVGSACERRGRAVALTRRKRLGNVRPKSGGEPEHLSASVCPSILGQTRATNRCLWAGRLHGQAGGCDAIGGRGIPGGGKWRSSIVGAASEPGRGARGNVEHPNGLAGAGGGQPPPMAGIARACSGSR